MATGATSRDRPGQRGKRIEDVVSYAIGHRTRVQLLIVLNQGTYCASELSDIIGEPITRVSNHLKELADGGSIEVAETRRRRNFDQHFYRAIEIPEHSKEELIAMHPLERQVTVGLVVQSLLAEIMAALWAGKISDDPDHCVVWDRLNLDEQGHREITEEQERHWERLEQIEKESLIRSARNGTDTTPYIVSILGFERGRKAPVAP
ncbi:MAG TPA: winged helix-turn-helix domain-containing protein [Solirubrobacterales bacterium]|nr:winged helix-turn-helix domain-containing protein [Solirubrobacterales bacterium]